MIVDGYRQLIVDGYRQSGDNSAMMSKVIYIAAWKARKRMLAATTELPFKPVSKPVLVLSGDDYPTYLNTAAARHLRSV